MNNIDDLQIVNIPGTEYAVKGYKELNTLKDQLNVSSIDEAINIIFGIFLSGNTWLRSMTVSGDISFKGSITEALHEGKLRLEDYNHRVFYPSWDSLVETFAKISASKECNQPTIIGDCEYIAASTILQLWLYSDTIYRSRDEADKRLTNDMFLIDKSISY